jgi:hypothetical protein
MESSGDGSKIRTCTTTSPATPVNMVIVCGEPAGSRQDGCAEDSLMKQDWRPNMQNILVILILILISADSLAKQSTLATALELIKNPGSGAGLIYYEDRGYLISANGHSIIDVSKSEIDAIVQAAKAAEDKGFLVRGYRETDGFKAPLPCFAGCRSIQYENTTVDVGCVPTTCELSGLKKTRIRFDQLSEEANKKAQAPGDVVR